jgi:hypothetical protein
MGYRSTVAYTIRFTKNREEDDYNDMQGAFMVFLEQVTHNKDTEKCFTEYNALFRDDIDKEGIEVDKEGCSINFFASSVKWYDDYEEVKAHEYLIKTARDWLNEDNPHSQYLGYVYCRVGEEVEDNVWEIGGNGDYEWITLSRQVVCDWL